MRSFLLGEDTLAAELFGDSEWPLRLPQGMELQEDDVLFDLREEAWDLPLYRSSVALVFLNAVVGTLAGHHAPANVVRLNGWPGMLARPAVECAAHPSIRQKAEAAMQTLGRQVLWVSDTPGMVSARVLAMIINEAHIAEREDVSDQASIDIAMELGTNYPKGPFAWAEEIGEARISRLLQVLGEQNDRYRTAQPFNNAP
jgi:3-hydroxybutyryl-CoA dehydrogenase